jgi:hypothetical protein
MFEMNSQSTNAGKGSNLSAAGASVFQLSHMAVQQKMIKKKFMLPTCVVIHKASLLIGDSFSLWCTCMSAMGL